MSVCRSDLLMEHQGDLASVSRGAGLLNDNRQFIQNTAESGHRTLNPGDTRRLPARFASTRNSCKGQRRKEE